MLNFIPIAVNPDGRSPVKSHGYQLHIGHMTPSSVGEVTLNNKKPSGKPSILFNYLSTEKDRREWIDGVKIARKILSQNAFQEFDRGEINPGLQINSDNHLLDWVRNQVETNFHPCGTCKMGTDPLSVVAPKTLEVYGVKGLRIVDASIFPKITNANLFAPTAMVAEKAADIILETSN